MQTNSLTGRHALVTGAARGIGAEIARTLAAEGAVLTLLGRDREALPARGRFAARAAAMAWSPPTWPIRRPVHAAFAQARAARGPDRDPRQQRRRGRERALPEDLGRALAAHAVRQPDRQLPVRAGRAARHAGSRLGPHRQHREHGRAEGLCLRRGLHGGQARRDRPDALAGAGGGAQGRHGQRRVPRLHRHRHPARQRGQRGRARPAAARTTRWPSSRSSIRSGASCSLPKWPMRCAGCAARARRRSTASRSRCPEAK